MYWTPGVKFGNSVLFLFHIIKTRSYHENKGKKKQFLPPKKTHTHYVWVVAKSFRLVNMTSISERMALNKVAYGHRPIRGFPNQE